MPKKRGGNWGERRNASLVTPTESIHFSIGVPDSLVEPRTPSSGEWQI